MMTALLILAAIASLASAAFFAGAETAFLSVSRERILHMARQGGRKALIVQAALSNMARTTTTLLIGNNIASVAYSASSAALALRFGVGSTAQVVWNLAAAFLVLYVSEFTPKLLCAARPLRRSLMLADIYRYVSALLSPLTFVAMRLTDLFMPRRESKYRLTMDDLMRILQDRKDGVCVSDFEAELIGRLVRLLAKNKPITFDALCEREEPLTSSKPI